MSLDLKNLYASNNEERIKEIDLQMEQLEKNKHYLFECFENLCENVTKMISQQEMLNKEKESLLRRRRGRDDILEEDEQKEENFDFVKQEPLVEEARKITSGEATSEKISEDDDKIKGLYRKKGTDLYEAKYCAFSKSIHLGSGPKEKMIPLIKDVNKFMEGGKNEEQLRKYVLKRREYYNCSRIKIKI